MERFHHKSRINWFISSKSQLELDPFAKQLLSAILCRPHSRLPIICNRQQQYYFQHSDSRKSLIIQDEIAAIENYVNLGIGSF